MHLHEAVSRLQGISTLLCMAFFFVAYAPAFAQQQFGEIGDLKLVSGETLRECRVGYRTYGLDNPCGHSIHACPDNGMGSMILKFLAQ
jgi:homoserine acetyltransferase